MAPQQRGCDDSITHSSRSRTHAPSLSRPPHALIASAFWLWQVVLILYVLLYRTALAAAEREVKLQSLRALAQVGVANAGSGSATTSPKWAQ